MEIPATQPPHRHVFVSYRRSDRARIDPVLEELAGIGHAVWLDIEGIDAGVEWWAAIEVAIRDALAFVCFLTPAYFRSEVCLREIDAARRMGKRMIPVTLEPVDGAPDLPPWLPELHWIVVDADAQRAELGRIATEIDEAARSDPDWTEFHSTLLGQASRWDEAERSSARLLKGDDIVVAERMLASFHGPDHLPATTLQHEFVAESARARRRNRRILATTVALVTAGSLTLATIALLQWRAQSEQRKRAEDQEQIANEQRDVAVAAEDRALSALAASDFERLSARSRDAPTRQEAIQAALAASALAQDHEEFRDRAHLTLLETEANRERPIAEFVAQADDQGASGGNQGVDISRDGSTLAVADPSGGVRVVDLWSMTTTHLIDPPESVGLGAQVALSADGSRVARVVSDFDAVAPAQINKPDASLGRSVTEVELVPIALSDIRGEVEVFDVTGPTLRRVSARSVGLDAAATAVAFGPTDDALVIVEEALVATVVDPSAPDDQTTAQLGTPVQRSNADLFSVRVSADGNRICTTAGAYYQIDPPMVIGQFGYVDCVPEPCADDERNMQAVVEGWRSCLAPGGEVVDQGERCAPCARTFGDVDVEAGSYLAVTTTGVLVPGPLGNQRVDVRDGRVAVYAETGSGLLPARTLEPSEPPRAVAVAGRATYAVAEDGQIWEAAPGDALKPTGRLLPGENLTNLEVGADGTLYWRDGDVIMRFDASGGEATSVATIDGAAEVAFGTDAVFVSDGESLFRVPLDAAAAPTRVEMPGLPCAVAVSAAGDHLAVVSCAGEGSGSTMYLADASDVGDQPTLVAPTPITNAGSVVVSDDAETIVVANGAGQIAVYHDGEFIQPAALLSEPVQTNDYQEGWIAVSPEGDFVVTRRNAEGFHLWAIDGGSMTDVGVLLRGRASDLLFELPSAGFHDGQLTIASGPSYEAGNGLMTTWDIGYDEVRHRTCTEWVAQPGDDPLPDLSRYEPDCAAASAPAFTSSSVEVAVHVADDAEPMWVFEEVDAFLIGTHETSTDVALDPDLGIFVTGFDDPGAFLARISAGSERATVGVSPGSLARMPIPDGDGGVWYGRPSASGDGLDIVRVNANLEEEPVRPDLVNRPRTFAALGSIVWFAADGSVMQSSGDDGTTLITTADGAPGEVAWRAAASWGFESEPIVAAAFIGDAAAGQSTLLTIGPDLTPAYRGLPERYDMVTIAPDGSVWLGQNLSSADVGTTGSDLRYVRPDGRTGTVRIEGHLTRSIEVDDLGEVWFTTGSAVGRISRNGDVWVNEVVGARFLNDVAIDRSSSTLWLTAIDVGVLRVRYRDLAPTSDPAIVTSMLDSSNVLRDCGQLGDVAARHTDQALAESAAMLTVDEGEFAACTIRFIPLPDAPEINAPVFELRLSSPALGATPSWNGSALEIRDVKLGDPLSGLDESYSNFFGFGTEYIARRGPLQIEMWVGFGLEFDVAGFLDDVVADVPTDDDLAA